MSGEYLVMNAADPMPARTHFPVREGAQVIAERRAEGLEHLLHGIEWNTADQQELSAHSFLSSTSFRLLRAF
jgi:hypothetical protein